MRISDWSSDVCSSDLVVVGHITKTERHPQADRLQVCEVDAGQDAPLQIVCGAPNARVGIKVPCALVGATLPGGMAITAAQLRGVDSFGMRSEEHTSELQSLMRISYAVFCLKKKTKHTPSITHYARAKLNG